MLLFSRGKKEWGNCPKDAGFSTIHFVSSIIGYRGAALFCLGFVHIHFIPVDNIPLKHTRWPPSIIVYACLDAVDSQEETCPYSRTG